jgi:hypothetical protein
MVSMTQTFIDTLRHRGDAERDVLRLLDAARLGVLRRAQHGSPVRPRRLITLPNLVGLLLLSGLVVRETREFFAQPGWRESGQPSSRSERS